MLATRISFMNQTRALIKTPDRYDPEPNRTYEEFAKHYGCAVLAARPAHPRARPGRRHRITVVLFSWP